MGLLSLLTALAVAARAVAATSVLETKCNGKSYTYNELAGYGFVPSNARDKLGDTISLGSSIAFSSWKKVGDKYQGTFYGLPDRGWNTQGTINFPPRLHKFAVTLTPAPSASVSRPSPPNLVVQYQDTILLTGPDGELATGLDPDQTGGLTYPGFPVLPAATYPGNGFGGPGPGGKRVSLDAEGLFLGDKGTFWISDEYGPYVYQFSAGGRMLAAIAPPDALLPLRNGKVSFASDNPPLYNASKHPVPANPTAGRQNNQGFEGLTVSPDGKFLYTLLQSAARQEGGSDAATRRYARLLQYSIAGSGPGPRDYPSHGPDDRPGGGSRAVFTAEYVVPLPTYLNAAGQTRVAAQSELHFVSPTQFLFLPRDSGGGAGLSNSTSLYRHVDILDIAAATNVKGPAYDAFNASIASAAGVLKAGIAPATVCSFVDVNINSQLNRFGVHNGGAQDAGLLNEKWEGLALLPVSGRDDKPDPNDEYYLFVASDNDFITQNGFTGFGQIQYKDASGFNLASQILVFKVTLPKGSKPLVG